MAKPQPTTVNSSDCPVLVDGASTYPHEGESVSLIRSRSYAQSRVGRERMALSVAFDAARGDREEMARVNREFERVFDDTLTFLDERVIAWTWTDLRGRPLPQPSREVLRQLSISELDWLVGAIISETAGEEKKDSRPSPTG